MDALEVNTTELPQATITNEESAIKWVEELIREMNKRRAACDVPMPDKKQKSVVRAQRNMWSFLTKQGEVTGTLKTLVMCGLISGHTYQLMNQQAINSLIPTVVGSA